MAHYRRDALEAADDNFWASMLLIEEGQTGATDKRRLRETLPNGIDPPVHAPKDQLVQTAELGELLDRIDVVKRVSAPQRAVSISEAFDIYRREIVAVDLIQTSDHQKALWEKTKRRAVTYFVKIVGDKPMQKITLNDARAFYNWWAERLIPEPGKIHFVISLLKIARSLRCSRLKIVGSVKGCRYLAFSMASMKRQ